MPSFEEDANQAILDILNPSKTKRLVMAGPGTGKTFLFRKLLEQSRARNADAKHLVVTFIRALKHDLEQDLQGLGNVYTFHGYCNALLKRIPPLRGGLTSKFQVYPKLPLLVAFDWVRLTGTQVQAYKKAEDFVRLMQKAVENSDTQFYLERTTHYEAVGLDEMVYRSYLALNAAPQFIEQYDDILVDEYQDFNRLEVLLLDLLSTRSPILIAGDDDQALYDVMRGASWEYIRALWEGTEYENFTLPFCRRCPRVILEAFHDVLGEAQRLRHLGGRVGKAYEYYPPDKDEDSKKHPHITFIQTSVQRKNVNLFAEIIEHVALSMPRAYVREAAQKGFPAMLVIGSRHYLRDVSEYLKGRGHRVETREESEVSDRKFEKIDAIQLLRETPDSNLAWRVALEAYSPTFFTRDPASFIKHNDILRVLPKNFVGRVRRDVERFNEPEQAAPANDPNKPVIRLTSFQGAKGLSAQYVVIAGLHNGVMPGDPARLKDAEICKFLVALTRTRKQCYVLTTRNFGGIPQRTSLFADWIKADRKKIITNVDRAYVDKYIRGEK